MTRPAARILVAILALLAASTALVLPQPAAAQQVDACGLPVGAPSLPDSMKPHVAATKVADAITTGCASSVSGLTIKGDLVFPVDTLQMPVSILGSIVDGAIVFIDVSVPPGGINLSGTRVTGLVRFEGIRSTMAGVSVALTLKDSRLGNDLQVVAETASGDGKAPPAALELSLEGARVDGRADFRSVRFASLNLSRAAIGEVAWDDVTLDGPLWPPARVDRLAVGMSWNVVREHRPDAIPEADFLGQWETVFSGVGAHADARAIRITARKNTIRPIRNWLIAGWLIEVVFLGLLYGFWSHQLIGGLGLRALPLRFVASGALSVQNSLPGVDPLTRGIMDQVTKDWRPLKGFDRLQHILIGGQRLAGWVALTIGGALIVAWYIA